MRDGDAGWALAMFEAFTCLLSCVVMCCHVLSCVAVIEAFVAALSAWKMRKMRRSEDAF
jgi:hypothetical protein